MEVTLTAVNRSAAELDRADPAPARHEFELPDGVAYLAGNSLGPYSRAAAAEVAQVLDQWRRLAVRGHHDGEHPWIDYHDRIVDPLARLVGALPTEVVAMNTLTVNLHLMLMSFYRPSPARHVILVSEPGFPSDRYAVASHVAARGYPGSVRTVRGDQLERELARPDVALALLEGVNYLTGELADIGALTALGRENGVVMGWDLAHAAGNVELSLHDWNVDFAAWCSYKYLNAGPGSMAAAFVHERHATDRHLPRLTGWWSNRAETRFDMLAELDLQLGAKGWQLSNPSMLALAPFIGALSIFDRVGMVSLRARSLRLTGQFADWLGPLVEQGRLHIVTPTAPARRGAQLSLRIPDANRITQRLHDEHGVVGDDREPDIVRLTPAPLYSTYADVRRAVDALDAVLPESRRRLT